jgi:hypothetical protein
MIKMMLVPQGVKDYHHQKQKIPALPSAKSSPSHPVQRSDAFMHEA